MKKTAIIAALVFCSMLSAYSLQAQEPGGTQYGIFLNTGFGWANNLRLEDWLNTNRDYIQNTYSLYFTAPPVEGDEKGTVLYGGFDIEPRMFLNKLVVGIGLGYHSTTTGERNLSGTNKYTGQPLNWHAEIGMKMVSVRGSAYYKVDLSSGSFILLGGGLGYYHGTLSIKRGFNDNIESHDVSSWTIGWHTGLEYNRRIGHLYVSAGFLSRFAEIYNFKANADDGTELIDTSGNLTGLYLYVGAGYMI